MGQNISKKISVEHCLSFNTEVTWPKNGSKAASDPVLIQTFVLF